MDLDIAKLKRLFETDPEYYRLPYFNTLLRAGRITEEEYWYELDEKEYIRRFIDVPKICLIDEEYLADGEQLIRPINDPIWERMILAFYGICNRFEIIEFEWATPAMGWAYMEIRKGEAYGVFVVDWEEEVFEFKENNPGMKVPKKGLGLEEGVMREWSFKTNNTFKELIKKIRVEERETGRDHFRAMRGEKI